MKKSSCIQNKAQNTQAHGAILAIDALLFYDD
jgi:hypothetical protein